MEGNDDVGSSSSNNNNNNNTAVVDDGSTTTTRPPGSVSYFPDQVAQISYLVAILEVDEDGSYIQDLTGGMDLLATELAPGFFPNAQLREVATSVNGWFPASTYYFFFVINDVSPYISSDLVYLVFQESPPLESDAQFMIPSCLSPPPVC